MMIGRKFDPPARVALAGLALPRAACSVGVLALLGLIGTVMPVPGHAIQPLPTACSLGVLAACGVATTNTQFVQSGAATYANTLATGGKTGQVTQTTQQAILNWQDFNIDPGYSMVFANPNFARGTWSTLNRIWQASPVTIGGSLKSDGQLYLLNQNGIVFSGSARVDTAMLIAATLNITDSQYLTGILTPHRSGASTTAGLLTPSFSPFGATTPGDISVQPGAVITAAGGKVMMFAPNVTNNGVIQTPDGQTILAAGQKAYLAGSTDPNLRGLLVEVDSGGTVTNNGSIITDRGNTTLVGLAVNQNGLISAATAVSANGSVRLIARSGAVDLNGNISGDINLSALTPGTVTLSKSSVTQLPADPTDTGTIDSSVNFLQSQVRVVGQKIVDQGSITAPNGVVSMFALTDPRQVEQGTDFSITAVAKDTASRIYLDSSATIDVSGTPELVLPMSRNVLSVQLRGNELRDDPAQQNGILRGQTVQVDVNQGTGLADISGYVAAIPRGILEKTLPGGSVSMVTNGDAILKSGSSIDVSAGHITYQDGVLNTTKLVSQGKMYDISSAPSNLVYDKLFNGTYNLTDSKWGVTRSFTSTLAQQDTPGFVEGKNAGSISIRANGIDLGGSMTGTTVAGPYQRSTGTVPKGGTLALSDFFGQGSTAVDFRHDVTFANSPSGSSVGTVNLLTDQLPATAFTTVSTDMLVSGGFSSVSIQRNGRITVPSGVTLSVAPASQLDSTGLAETDETRRAVVLTGTQISIGGNIVAPSRDIALATSLASGGTGTAGITLAPTANIVTRGLWVNDFLNAGSMAPTSPRLVNGGGLTLTTDTQGTLNLAGAQLDLTGGGWLSSRGILTPGNGGNLSISTATLPGLDANILAKAPSGTGGSFSLQLAFGTSDPLSATRSVVLINGQAGLLKADGGAPAQVDISADALGTLGFSSYSISTNANRVSVADGAKVNVVTPYLQFNPDYALKPSGSDVGTFTTVQASELIRLPASLTLAQTLTGAGGSSVLRVGSGSSIVTDPKGTVTLTSRGNIDIEGTVKAPGGTIGLTVTGGGENDFLPGEAIWLGANARLDASGAAVNQQVVKNVRQGTVLPGGTVTLQANRGYIVANAGSAIDASGGIDAGNGQRGTITLDLPKGVAGAVVATQVGSDGGGINLTSAEGMLLDGTLLAPGTGAGSAGGSLSVTLSTRSRGDSGVPSSVSTGFPVTTRSVVLREGNAASVPGTLAFGDPVPNNGQALLNASSVVAGGFERLSLTARQGTAQLQDPTAPPSTFVFVPAEVRLQGNVALSLNQSLQIDAPAIAVGTRDAVTGLVNPNSGTATLGAAYVALGNSDVEPLRLAALPAASGGAGNTLTVNASLIDLGGHSVVQGADSVTLSSTGDIRARSVVVQRPVTGGTQYTAEGDFTVAKDLTLGAQQIYPVTASNFTLQSQGGTLTTQQATGTPGQVLSAGGNLVVQAPVVDHFGTLAAPLGTLSLKGSGATGKVTLETGSVTSVSANGNVIPYGATENHTDWTYTLTAPDGTSFKSVLSAPPGKQVQVTATGIEVKSGSKVDLSGGGDLRAFEFVAGTGGSKDILANTVTTGGVTSQNTEFAVLPGLGSAFAPIDPALYAGSTLKPGSTVYLAGIPGLAAGTYALLPARYALLPGAFLVKPVSSYPDLVPGRTAGQSDGTVVTAGYLTAVGASPDGRRTSGFAVRPGSAALAGNGTLAGSQAQYDLSSANTFFAATDPGAVSPRLPQDGGRLSLASSTLTLQGSLVAAHDAGSRGGEVDINAAAIKVVGDAAGPGAAGVLQVKASDLTNFGAESLLLGGTRSQSGAAEVVSVGAATIEVANGATSPLSGAEVMLAASDTITVRAGAVIRGEKAYKGTPQNIVIGSDAVTDSTGAITQAAVSGQGAFLRAASADAITITRNNIGARTQGTLSIEAPAAGGAAAVIAAAKSLALDATKDTTNNGTLDITTGGALSIAAGNVTFGDTSGVASGLLIPTASLGTFKGLGALTLRSYGSIDFRGPVAFGTTDPVTGQRQLKNLAFETGTLNGFNAAGGAAGDVTIVADSFSLANPTGTAGSGAAGSGTGTFKVNAGTITLGTGSKALAGYAGTSLVSTGDLSAQGTGSLNVSGGLTLDAARITGSKLAGQSVTATGAVTIRRTASDAGLAAVTDLAAQWSVAGASVFDSGNFVLPSGQVTLTATGAAGDLTVTRDASGRAAVIDVGGFKRTFDGITAVSSAGSVTLASQQGNLSVLDGSSINVSGTADGGNAGSLSISAPLGSAVLQASDAGATKAISLRGTTVSDQFQGGRFSEDAQLLLTAAGQTANQLAAVNNLLAGFGGERTLRARTGDLSLAAGQTIKAGAIDLSADAGALSIAGTLDASGATGGKIALWARSGVPANSGNVTISGTLDASGAAGKGGDIIASSDGGTLDASAGTLRTGGASVIVNSSQTAGNGSVVLRATRTAAGTDLNLASGSLAGITGASSVVVEGVKVYSGITQIAAGSDSGTTLGLGTTGQMTTQATTFNGAAAAISTRLAAPANVASVLHVRPGVEVRSTGDLAVSSDWGLQASQWRSTGGEPIMLTLRAGGNLNLTGSAIGAQFNTAVLNDAFSSTNVSTLSSATGALTSSATLVGGESASYRLVGGADTGAANAQRVLYQSQLAANSGDVVLPAGKVVRTGNGDIVIAAARNFELGKAASGPNQASAAVYTAGLPTSAADYAVLNGYRAPGGTGTGNAISAQVTTGANQVQANFPRNGGDLSITAGKDINGAVTSQLITEWQQRIGLDNTDGTIRFINSTGRSGPYNTAWWIDYGKFKENVGALGGGNVQVRAGGDINNLSVVIPTTGRLGGNFPSTNSLAVNAALKVNPDPANLVVEGGGNLDVEARGNILSGVYYVGRGNGVLEAGGGIVPGRTVNDTNPNAGRDPNNPADLTAGASIRAQTVGTILAVGDAKFSAEAAGNLTIESVINPTIVLQDVAYATPALLTRKSQFYTYSADSAVSLTSTAGALTLSNNTSSIAQSAAPVQTGASPSATGLNYVSALNFSFVTNSDNSINALAVYPGQVTARALQGDINVLNSMTLFPSAKGTLSLLAQGSVNVTGASSINLSDANPALLNNPLFVPVVSSSTPAPVTATPNYADNNSRLQITPTTTTSTLTHVAGTPLHSGDTTGPAEIVANTGSISGGNFFFAKPVRVVAGTDIKNIQLQDQNLTASDVTFFSAGRDFSFATTRDPLTGNQTTNNTGVYVAGPGFLEVEAGRNLSFGNSSGVVGGGNATNLVLPKTSAAISATAGATSPANYAAFLGTYVDPAGSGYVSDYAGQLSDYLASIGKSVTGLSDAQKLALFKGLGVQLQTPFVQKVFYNELTQSGLSAATQGETGYARGTNAINALFPAGGQYRGSLTMLFSQIRTKAGGDINIQVPGGDVNVGQTTQSAGAATKTVDKLGIVAEGAGSVHSYLSGNFNVNESRVFTLNGGDILVWSNEGNIDAGKGAKTATSSPPPTVITNPDGTTVFKFSSVSGSGIRGILTDRTLTPGDVTLVAPKGEVIAGDAGIGSAGNIVIAAVRVVGADNIQVAGQSTGVPTVQAVSPASGLAGASNVGSDAAKAAENATRNVADASRAGQSLQQNFRPSFVTVQVFCVGAACSQ